MRCVYFDNRPLCLHGQWDHFWPHGLYRLDFPRHLRRNWQCGSPNGLLFPYKRLFSRHGHPSLYDGAHPTLLYSDRHDRNCPQRLVRCVHHRRPRQRPFPIHQHDPRTLQRSRLIPTSHGSLGILHKKCPETGQIFRLSKDFVRND